MSEVPSTGTPAFKNRRPGLIGCGIVHLLFGLLFVGFALLMVITLVAAPPEAAAAMPAGMTVYTGLFYLALATLFATLGIGSMMARRWAPPLILVTSWGWLLCGVVGAGAISFMMPQITASLPNDQQAAKPVIAGCMSLGIGLFGIVLPLAFILFYRSTHVKATAEQLDPVPRWTDRQPISLLIFASWMFFGAASVLLSSFMYKALPIGGFMLRGWPVFAVMAAMATLLFWIGVGTLRRLPSAWWSAVGMLVIGVAWGALFTFSTDPLAMYEAMGMPANPEQEAITKAMYSSPLFYAWIAIVWIGYLVFLLYLRRYFFPQSKPHSERPAV
ncbi:MAG: hypothetical protein M3P06_21650 [Acidobacteriota bacterium]|nr:hypothetical protein [Acidobacteriota bacterium]